MVGKAKAEPKQVQVDPMIRLDYGIRTVAVFEAVKGTLVLVVGLGLLSLIHNDIQLLGEQIIGHLHLNPANYWQKIFLSAFTSLAKVRPILLVAGSVIYASIRLIEAYGLWYGKRWAEWFAALSVGLYIPVEVYKLFSHVSMLRIGVLSVNVLVVALMLYALIKRQVVLISSPPNQ